MSDASEPGHGGQPGYGSQPSYAAQPAYGAQPGYANYGTRPTAYAHQPGYHPELGYTPPYSPTPTNTSAVLSLVLAFLFPPAGLVVGLVARSQLKRSHEQGDGLATAGIILSAIFTAAMLLVCGSIVMMIVGAATSAR